jgi:molybdopterin-synthase adenylyltransferase
MTRLRLCPSASITPTEGAVILRSDLGAFSVSGADLRTFVDQIVPLLDGSLDRRGVERELGSYAPKSVSRFLDLMKARGLIEETEEQKAPALEDRWRGQGAFLRKCGARGSLRASRVAVWGADALALAAARALAASGLGAIDLLECEAKGAGEIHEASPWCRVEAQRVDILFTEPPALLLVTIDPGDLALVRRVSWTAHEAGVRSLWGHQAGTTSMLGPLVIPGKTACRLCATAGGLGPRMPDGERQSRIDLVAAGLAMEAIKIITAYAPATLAGRMLAQDQTTFETRMHTLVMLPWCRVCGG